MPDRVILAVQYTPASSARAVGRAVGGFLRYVQYRDKHRDPEPTRRTPQGVSGLLKYVAYRDASVPRGLLFGPDGPAGDAERRELSGFVSRAVAGSRPHVSTAAGPDRRRAVYRMVISPERADGLDLRALTRATMRQLAADAGGVRLRWIAAEHRNTAHPHVHVVLAGFTEQPDGRMRGLMLTKPRLQRMKDALRDEIGRQRGAASERVESQLRSVHGPARVLVAVPLAMDSARPAARRPQPALRGSLAAAVTHGRPRSSGHPVGLVRVRAALRRAASSYLADLEREQRAIAHAQEPER